MYELYVNFIHLLLIIIGAILGACLRFKLINEFERYSFNQNWGILIINLLSTFALGFLFGIRPKLASSDLNVPFSLLIGVGFLGSFSTFSTFIFQLSETLQNQKFQEFFLLFFASVLGGLVIAVIGYSLGHG